MPAPADSPAAVATGSFAPASFDARYGPAPAIKRIVAAGPLIFEGYHLPTMNRYLIASEYSP